MEDPASIIRQEPGSLRPETSTEIDPHPFGHRTGADNVTRFEVPRTGINQQMPIHVPGLGWAVTDSMGAIAGVL